VAVVTANYFRLPPDFGFSVHQLEHRGTCPGALDEIGEGVEQVGAPRLQEQEDYAFSGQ
jgi:hypothetical protein